MALLMRRRGARGCARLYWQAAWASATVRGLAAGRSKVVTVEDAVSLVRDGDTVFTSGFVTQGIAESVLRALGERFAKTQSPRGLTLMFYGMGDPRGGRATNHFSAPGMLRRVICSHFGQSPALQPLILRNEIEAYALPMGSLARMVRSRASGAPGHFTRVGLGTFVDPRHGGGRCNARTTEELVELVHIDGQEYLRYRGLPINVGIIRATTADPDGNLTTEHESVLPDLAAIATSVRASGGIVIAQVERIAQAGSLRMRDVSVPGALVDCVVQATCKEDNNMSLYTQYDPSWSGEIKAHVSASALHMPMGPRKVIARRAAMFLRPDDVVNLGIGMPEGVASVCAEEGVDAAVTLTTEAGLIGGLGASGYDFGPAMNATARQELGAQFDFYDGGGLNVAFLGAGEVDARGHVNVHKLSADSLTGPGGFVNISQSTHRIVFVGTMTKKGLKVSVRDGKLIIDQEGEVNMFCSKVREVTFNGEVARRNAQDVSYVTERAVFKLHPSGALELTEIAPGVDLDKDVLGRMDFTPLFDRASLKIMDPAIFREGKMRFKSTFFQQDDDFARRFKYNAESNTLFVDLSGTYIHSEEQVGAIVAGARKVLDEITEFGWKKVHCVSSYDHTDIEPECQAKLARELKSIDEQYFLSVRRLAGKTFYRESVFKAMELWDNKKIWVSLCESLCKETLSRAEALKGLQAFFQTKLSVDELHLVLGNETTVDDSNAEAIITRFTEVLTSRAGMQPGSRKPSKVSSVEF
jgi:propionate CoA-transferase